MKILNIGSLNIDDVYQVDHFVRPGETLTSLAYRQYAGGKGLNQSIALARAGARVFHGGKIGRDGFFLKEKLDHAGVDTRRVITGEVPNGRAIIQVTKEGENSILLFSGSNRSLTPEEIDPMLEDFTGEDILLLQNEINCLDIIIERAHARGMTIVLNPAPMDEKVLSLPLEKIGIFILNEIEGAGLTGEDDPDGILRVLEGRFPGSRFVLTLGSAGVKYSGEGLRLEVPARKVTPVDTTAAGDTFTGYFLTALTLGKTPETALREATAASAVTVTRPGASDSIPLRRELGLD